MEPIKTLSDVYNPLAVMPLLQNQERVELARQSNELHRAQLAKDMVKMALDERRNSLKDALPNMPIGEQKVKALNELLNLGASPRDPRYEVTMEDLHSDGALWEAAVSAPNTPKGKQAFQQLLATNQGLAKFANEEITRRRGVAGAGQLASAAGLPQTPEVAEAVAASGPLQSQVGQVVAETRLERARANELEVSAEAKQAQIAAVNIEGRALEDGLAPAKANLDLGERFIPHIETLDGMKDSLARSTARDRLEMENPLFKQWNENRISMRTELSDRLAALQSQRSEIQGALRRAAWGESLPPGETITSLEARLRTVDTLTNLTESEYGFVRNPNKETAAQLRQHTSTIEGHVRTLKGQRETLSRERLDLAESAQSLKERRYTEAQDKEQRIARAQAELQKAGSKDRAGEIAAKHKVKVTDILGALEDPTQKGKVSIDVGRPTVPVVTASQKALTQLEGTENLITELRKNVKQSNVGLVGMFRKGAAGLEAQIRGAAEGITGEIASRGDQVNARLFFDPSLPTMEVLSNTLAYKIAASENDRVSNEDFKQVKTRLGLDDLTGDAPAVLARLDAIEKQLHFEKSVHRRIVGKFPKDPQAPPTADLSKASNEDLFKMLMGQ